MLIWYFCCYICYYVDCKKCEFKKTEKQPLEAVEGAFASRAEVWWWVVDAGAEINQRNEGLNEIKYQIEALESEVKARDYVNSDIVRELQTAETIRVALRSFLSGRGAPFQ